MVFHKSKACLFWSMKTHYFFTNTGSKHAKHFLNNSKSVVYYCDDTKDLYKGALFTGTMEVCTEHETKAIRSPILIWSSIPYFIKLSYQNWLLLTSQLPHFLNYSFVSFLPSITESGVKFCQFMNIHLLLFLHFLLNIPAGSILCQLYLLTIAKNSLPI